MTVLVFGATGGIGQAVCERLHAQGIPLVMVARDADRFQALQARFGGQVHAADAAVYKEVEAAVTAAAQSDVPLQGVVHCVGSVLLKPAHLVQPDQWQELLTTNLTSAFWVVKAAAKAMYKTGGNIILISSAASKLGLPNHDAVGAVKAGINGLVINSAASYARRQIRVNAVAPGMVETPMTESLLDSEAARTASEAFHPLGRIGQPQDVASAVTWLLSPQQSWMTGQILSVDGGLTQLKTI